MLYEYFQKRLYKELDVCFCGLQSLVQICLQQADGQDPNISLLLGAKSKSNGFTMIKQIGYYGIQSFDNIGTVICS